MVYTNNIEVMESKPGSTGSGVVRYRLAKDSYDGTSGSDAKQSRAAESKTTSSSSSGSESKGGLFDRSQEKAALIEIQEDMEADDEFEQLKRAPTSVAPTIAPTKYARNFVAGFKM